jgi:hypothetical protein
MDGRPIIFLVKPLLYLVLFLLGMFVFPQLQRRWWRPLLGGALRIVLGLGPGVVWGFASETVLQNELVFVVIYAVFRFLLWLLAGRLAFWKSPIRPLIFISLAGTILNFIIDALWLPESLYKLFNITNLSFC